jgi:hypothetical protein
MRQPLPEKTPAETNKLYQDTLLRFALAYLSANLDEAREFLDDRLADAGFSGWVTTEADIEKIAASLAEPRSIRLITAAIAGLAEYIACLDDANVIAEIRRTVVVPDTGNDQLDYEDVRNQVERICARREDELQGQGPEGPSKC